MREEKEQEEKVGVIDLDLHRSEAREWCLAADREGANQNHVNARTFAAVSQAHASLAIADQLERLNEMLAASNLTYADGMVRNA